MTIQCPLPFKALKGTFNIQIHFIQNIVCSGRFTIFYRLHTYIANSFTLFIFSKAPTFDNIFLTISPQPGPILAVYYVKLLHAIIYPFSKYFQILYIFVLFPKNCTPMPLLPRIGPVNETQDEYKKNLMRQSYFFVFRNYKTTLCSFIQATLL